MKPVTLKYERGPQEFKERQVNGSRHYCPVYREAHPSDVCVLYLMPEVIDLIIMW